jgi:hypothetical protein
VDGRDAIAPRAGALELAGEAKQGGLVGVAADELDADGRPSGVQCSGTDMAGWPVMLKTGVKGMNS